LFRGNGRPRSHRRAPSPLVNRGATGYSILVGFRKELKGNPPPDLSGEPELPPQL
jgi:hypothetical protein